MKVIVQNIAARKFLAPGGEWVTDQSQAQDFCTLLRAYHFAEANTCVHFRVLLHSPDDGYFASIIEGTGHADGTMEFHATEKTILREPNRVEHAADLLKKCLDSSRAHLN